MRALDERVPNIGETNNYAECSDLSICHRSRSQYTASHFKFPNFENRVSALAAASLTTVECC